MSYLAPAIPFVLATAAWVILLLIARPKAQRSELAVHMDKLTRGFNEMERAIGEQLIPVLQRTTAAMAAFNATPIDYPIDREDPS